MMESAGAGTLKDSANPVKSSMVVGRLSQAPSVCTEYKEYYRARTLQSGAGMLESLVFHDFPPPIPLSALTDSQSYVKCTN